MSRGTDIPRVTVVVPTYRRPRLLVEALESILGGSYSDFEVIVANDGAVDDLSTARARFPDPRVQWITRPERLGMLSNHVEAFGRARGEFIANLDDDDRWTPGLLASLVPVLERHPEVAVAFADHFVADAAGVVDEVRTDANSRRWGRATLSEGPHRPFKKLAAIDRSIPMACAAVFRRSALNLADYAEPLGTCWDVWTSYLLARDGGTAWYVPRRLAVYREHSAGVTVAGRASTARSAIYCWEQFLKDAALRPWTGDLKRTLAAAHFRLATELLRVGDIRGGYRHAQRSVLIGLTAPAHFIPAGGGRRQGKCGR
jgi:glycosyltransferase involved in cell wall biosynthesis